jgi:hypothetical protein
LRGSADLAIQKNKYLIITETVFSMDGDLGKVIDFTYDLSNPQTFTNHSSCKKDASLVWKTFAIKI